LPLELRMMNTNIENIGTHEQPWYVIEVEGEQSRTSCSRVSGSHVDFILEEVRFLWVNRPPGELNRWYIMGTPVYTSKDLVGGLNAMFES